MADKSKPEEKAEQQPAKETKEEIKEEPTVEPTSDDTQPSETEEPKEEIKTDEPEPPVETETQEEQTSEQPVEDTTEPKPIEETAEPEPTDETPKEKPAEGETKPSIETESEKPKEKKKEQTPEPSKSEEPDKKESKEKTEQDDDYSYIVRIANTDIAGEKTLEFGLSQIKGIGRNMSVLVIKKTGINKNIKVGDLTDKQIDKIKETLEQLNEFTPGWMKNHRKEVRTGEDIHLLASDLDMKLRDDVNLMKMIRAYRGIRHELGLRARGQRTRSNNRSGLTMGVSKKRP